jgi:hypothetical protein
VQYPPVPTQGWQVPALQVPLQHWLLETQGSPLGRQAETQVPDEQLPLQHAPDDAQDCPRARHGWHSPATQLSLQQSDGWPQIAPSGAQQAAWHEPAQLLLQQSFAATQGPAEGAQLDGQLPNVLRTRGWTVAPNFTLPLGPSPYALSGVTRYQKKRPGAGISGIVPAPVVARAGIISRQESRGALPRHARLACSPR